MPDIQLLNMDCMEYMATLPDKAFDLVITSPPYNLGATHHTGNIRHNPYPDSMPESAYQLWQISIMNELRRVIKPTGSLFYNHKNRIKNGLQISPYEWILKTKWTVKQEIVWRNKSQNFDKIRFFPMTERVYWLAGPDVKAINNASLTDCVDETRWKPTKINSTHSRAFPVSMVSDILGLFPSTKKMFDPFMGSATSAIAAHYFGCDFVGTELDPDYYAAAVKRFDNETSQIAMELV